MKKFVGLAIAGLICAATVNVSADIFVFEANLDGLQEVPPNESPGVGIVTLTFDDSTNILEITSGFYEDLLSDVVASHIHAAPFGQNGGVILPLDHTGGTAGTLSGGGVLSDDDIASLFAGHLYVNVHTVGIPGGEIRGQIYQVPAPGALALLGAAGLISRRRRRN